MSHVSPPIVTKRPSASKRKVPFRPDLIWDARLQTDFLPNGVLRHTHFKSDSTNGQRRVACAERWTTKMKVGEGGFGRVWFQTNETGHVRALKEIRKDVAPAPIDYRRELEAAFKFSHSRYVHCFVESYGWFEDEKKVYISMEYLQHGDLRNVLNASALPEEEAKLLTRQLVEGLQLMHSNHFVHRDLKPANVLVVQPGPRWWVKISDFGISKRAYEATALRTSIGTEGYCAPEVLIGSVPVFDRAGSGRGREKEGEEEDEEEEEEDTYTAAVDMWALGEIVYRCLTQRPAFPTRRDMYVFVTNQRALNEEPLIERGCSKSCRHLILGLLAAIPSERFSADAAASHDWVRLSEDAEAEASSPVLWSKGYDLEAVSKPASQWMLPHPEDASTPPEPGTAAWTTMQDIRSHDYRSPPPTSEAAMSAAPGATPEQKSQIAGEDRKLSAGLSKPQENFRGSAATTIDDRPWQSQRRYVRAPFDPLRDAEPKSIRSQSPIPRSVAAQKIPAPYSDPEKEKLRLQVAALQEELVQARQERDRVAREWAGIEPHRGNARQVDAENDRLNRERQPSRIAREDAESAERRKLEEKAAAAAAAKKKEREEAEEEDDEGAHENVRSRAESENAKRQRRDAEHRAKMEREKKRKSMIAELVRAEIKEQEKKNWMNKSRGERALLRWITKKDPTQQ